MTEYAKMAPEEEDACALLAAEAFSGYEYFSIYIPDGRRRRRFLESLIRCEFKANRSRPDVEFLTAREDGRILAVAQLCAPGFMKPSDADYIRAGWFGVMLRGGVRRVGAWNDMEKIASAPCHELTGANWYLSLLTVSVSDEGKGIGSRFLGECLIPRVRDAGGQTFSLFTNSEANRRFYEKNGFTLFDEKRFEYGGSSIGSWSFRMDPQRQPSGGGV